VDGHQDLPSGGHEADGMVITESNRFLAIAPRDLLPADSALAADGEFAAGEEHTTARYALHPSSRATRIQTPDPAGTRR
jgi:hypothetical protein